MTICSNCHKPCQIIRVNWGPCCPEDTMLGRDRHSDGSDCCEDEVYEGEPEEEPTEELTDEPLYPDEFGD